MKKWTFHQKIFYSFFAVLVFWGIVVRLVGLGKWPLAIDEYYFGKSILNILFTGLPEFPCGGYYDRGILQQYLTAPLLAFSSDPEWALRIVPVVFNLLGIPAVYLLGKRLGGTSVAFGATILFSFSLWEIELARFARMYAPFQAVFLWELYFLAVILQERKRWAFIGMFLFAAIGIFVYEGAIFLVLVALVPFLVERRRPPLGDALVILALFAAAAVSQIVDFRHLGAAVSPDVKSVGGGSSLPVSFPPVLLASMIHSPVWVFVSIIPMVFLLRAFFCLWLKDREGIHSAGVWTLVLGCTIVNQFALAADLLLFFLLIGLITFPRKEKLFRSPLVVVFASAAVNLFFWSGYALVGAGYSPVRSLKTFFKFPDIFNQVLLPWFSAMPIMTSLLLALLCLGVLLAFTRGIESPELFRSILAVALGLVMVVGALKTPFTEARYTFFLYPVFLLAACKVLIEIPRFLIRHTPSSRWLGMGFIAIFVLLSEDFGIQHLTRISSPEINFRTIYLPARQLLYYPRQDYASPARYVNENIQDGDLVISLVPVVDFYLDKMDYRFESRESGRFRIISACGGERDIWSNAPLLSKEEELFRLIDGREGQVWVLAYSALWHYRAKEERMIENKYENALVYASIDKTINVFRIPPNPKRID